MATQVKAEEAPKKEECLSPVSLPPTNVKLEPKAQDEPSPSQSPTLNDSELLPQKGQLSLTPTPPPSTTNGTTSMSSTPPPATPTTGNSKKAQSPAVQLIGDLPVAREAAMATFNEILENNYQYKSLGRSREPLESMTCDCTFDPGIDYPDAACGPGSDCINRLTQVECLPDDCRCRSHCQNQRFQNRQYAHIEIVQTEMKGFGLRAERDLPRDTFIYEYVGDVVNPASFKKRMREYALEGIQHFYFMMLQKDEFIDATKSGGIGRFANHSCRPNCYVAKWTIGQHVRMGIFAKRDIQKHEELTFNYNVDRYGHQAQTCYCGESNCVGYIGGKTQTDVATMDDLYLDALGITDEAELMDLKGSKKKKGKKIDDPDFMPILKSIVEKDVPKVVQAIRQTQSRKVLYKLLMRIKISEDQAALRQIMRLRGYSLMTNVLDDHAADTELIQLALQCMSTWPLMNRNKVEDSRVLVPVKAIAEQDDSPNKDLAQSLLDHWETLPLYNRIPKRIKQDGEKSDDDPPESHRLWEDDDEAGWRPFKRPKSDAPLEIEKLNSQASLSYYPKKPRDPERERERERIREERELERERERKRRWEMEREVEERRRHASEATKESIKALIAAAAQAEAAREAAQLAAAEEARAEAEAAKAKAEARAAARAANGHRKKTKPPKKELTEAEKEANKEKRLMKLVGAVVVKCMSKHSKAMDHDTFKKHAKELTQIITEKEKKSSSYKENRLDKLSEEKVVKIKKFAKEYIAKILRKLAKSGKRGAPPPSPSSTSQSQVATRSVQETPNSTDGADVVMADMSIGDMTAEVSVNDIGLDLGSDAEGEGDDDVDDDEGDDGQEMQNGEGEGSASTTSPRESLPPPEPGDKMDVDVDASPQATIRPPSDPRRRPPRWEGEYPNGGAPTPASVLGMN
ncbi:putative class V-like SAM-binding methyltransferase superfamily, Histone-lysine methyltransferase family. SET2 subfamily protein [Lyophyllum shimeji]|uniref:Histone-lysine N-methyltransferase, H3 lysine-36 specific n=1 Tax=Lyophyllum shimeji TaxID=47721 RepID=A0A9P3UU10_LYOSH|nr:putative class V-like SAM-binding methyltransferase superfamily, Histone-lysine methyltransferase family. SET2 subfamily protein [Lyophyllum shimeji]